MKYVTILLALAITSYSYASTRGIICDREAGIRGCSQYLIYYKAQGNGYEPRLNIGDYNRDHICSTLGYIDTKETESLRPVIQFLTKKADKLPRKIKLEGESSSSNGFGLSTKTLVRIKIDMAAGNGELEYRSGKGPFNIFTDNYLSTSRNDPARNEVLVNCKEINL